MCICVYPYESWPNGPFIPLQHPYFISVQPARRLNKFIHIDIVELLSSFFQKQGVEFSFDRIDISFPFGCRNFQKQLFNAFPPWFFDHPSTSSRATGRIVTEPESSSKSISHSVVIFQFWVTAFGIFSDWHPRLLVKTCLLNFILSHHGKEQVFLKLLCT